MADRQMTPFADLFAEWDALRRFDGFVPDEFVSYEACCAAEQDYELRLARYETELLARTPTSQWEVASLLAVVNADEELTPQAFAALARIQTWMMSHGLKMEDGVTPPPLGWDPKAPSPSAGDVAP